MPVYKVTLTQTYQQEATVTLNKASEAEALAQVLELDKNGELEYLPVEFIATKITAVKTDDQP
jgi:carbamoylphosphate synthase large subunit